MTLTPDQRSAAEVWQRDQLAITDLAYFAYFAWERVHPGRELLWNWHLGLLCRELQDFTRPLWDPDCPDRASNELVVCVPPRSLKTYLDCICLHAWLWLYAPWVVIQAISCDDDLSAEASYTAMRLIQTEWYQRLLRLKGRLDGVPEDELPAWGFDAKQAGKANYKNTTGGHRYALGVKSSIIGKGADLQVIDDPSDIKDATLGTPEAVAARFAKIRSNYDNVWRNRLNDPGKSLRLTIAQRMDPDDLPGVLLGRGVRAVVLPMEFDPAFPAELGGVHPEDPRTEPGQLLMPRRWPQGWVDQSREVAPIQHEAQNNQRPTRKEGGLFKARHFANRYPEDPHLLRVDRIAIFVDCNFRKTTSGSFFCAQAWGMRGRAWFALLAQVRGRVSFSESLVMLKGLHEAWPRCYAVFVEAKANGDAVIDTLRDEIRGLQPWEPGTASKYERAEVGSEPVFGAGQAWFPTDERAPWMVGYVKRHIAFDGKRSPTNPDDEVDTSSAAMLKLSGRKGSAMERLKRSLPSFTGRR